MRMPKRKYARKGKGAVRGAVHRALKVCFQPCRCFTVGKRKKIKVGEVS